ncbi:uncharacterized protein LAJ45_03772 [Morchella importuna]|uniref:uncharacterized protein n=2 Tax=Morchella importuna TaxID=1174673 RepID=UPI001E8DA0A2|nr:uncharacterized protein LAJ45_04431 [Morchella importuna]XP_045973649.1 uncharacterized protein LAJ45_03772 [Morchella importuna]KAH8151229.1 hypothetical protein LAJ45_04431 [Morchella importuna]KAH8152345.1 hypothetical protein LAJ45_03772 [Morchella importuna]
MIPNVVLEPAMMRHLRLMKVRMEGNVAQDIHMRYIQAVQAFDNSEVSVTDEATAKRELGVITEIYHVRLLLLYTDTAYVKITMEYKESFANQETPQSSVRDYWDSLLFKMVKNNRGLWTDSRDIGQYDVWPLLLINCNLPPSERVLKKNLILCGIIPGPGNPKDLGSFLKPMIDEFLTLQVGVKAWDGLRKERFILRANIALVAGDTVAMAKLMKWTGPNSFRYCRFCAIYGISEGHIYCPLEPPRDRKDALGGEARRKGSRVPKRNANFPEKSWDAENLPIWTDAQVRENQKTVEETMDLQWGKMMGTNGEPVFSSLVSVVYPWTFTPDVMHLVDENTPRLYLAQWMGVFRDRELALRAKMAQAEVDASQVGSSHAQSEGMSQSQVEVQQESQFDSQTNTQQGGSQSQTQGERRKRRKGRRGVSFNADIEEDYVEDAFILPKRMWDRIGEEIAGSRASIPSAFGKAFRDIKYHASYKATELMNFMHLISPIVLNQRLPAEYYSHWHHFVLASEKARRYQLSMEDVAEMERDMVQVVTGYERLYYQYKLSKIRGCTTQVHGLLHLGMAMKVCGPNPIYHQYPMERTCGTIKAMCHSRSSANRNLSLQLLERERLRYLPLIALVPPGFSETAERRLFGLGEKDKVAYPAEYPDCLLMGPKISRRLNQYERNHLRQFHADVIGVPVRSREIVGNPMLFSGIFKLWGRAVAGRVLSNSSEHEVVGSAISNPKPGVCSSRRDDSCVRYILTGDGDNDVSYFGKVMFFMPYEIHNDERLEDEPERFMMAYIQRLEVGRVRKLKLAYIINRQQRVLKEFVDLSDVQELIGCIKSRGKEFLVSRTSCFWPKKGFAWWEVIDNEALFIGANVQ